MIIMTECHHAPGVGKDFFNRKVQIVEAKQGEESVCTQGVEGWQLSRTGPWSLSRKRRVSIWAEQWKQADVFCLNLNVAVAVVRHEV